MKKINKIKIILIAFFMLLAGIIFILSGIFAEPSINDFFTQKLVSHKTHGSSDIVLVVIDDNSLAQIRWPWKRNLYSEIFDFLENKANAKLILFDGIISSPDDSKEADQALYNYLSKSKKLIMGFDMCKTDNDCGLLPEEYYPEFNKKFDLSIKNLKKFDYIKNSYTGIMKMPPEFLHNVKNIGSVIVMDRLSENIKNDKIIRTYSNLVNFNSRYYPSLALVGYSKLTGEKNFIISDKYITAEKAGLKIKLPPSAKTSQSNYVYLKWYKPYKNSYYTHKEYSAIDVLNLSRMPSGSKIKTKSGEILSADTFKNKIIFIGGNAKAQSLDDKLGSPVSPNHAGVDIQATALNNYLDNTFTQKAGVILNIFISTIILLISFAAIQFFTPVISLTFNICLTFIYFLIYLGFLNNDFILNFITIFFLEVLLFAFAYIYQFVAEGEKKEKIQKAMGKYLSIDVMQKVVKDIDNITLGGKKVEATIMFIDIRKFTTISENMAADDVTLLLNEYFTTIYPIITKYNGVLNKFIGDAVLAIFEDEQNHAKNAIFCAGEVLEQIKKLQQKWLSE